MAVVMLSESSKVSRMKTHPLRNFKGSKIWACCQAKSSITFEKQNILEKKENADVSLVTQSNLFAQCLYFPTNFVFFKKDNKRIVLTAN